MMVLTLPIETDIVVQAADGDVLALVEVKNPETLTPEFAAILRRNLIPRSRVRWWPRYFLVVSQDVGYLWDEDALPQEETPPPTLEFPTYSIVEHYLPSFADGRRVSGSGLELAVLQWLWDLANGVENRPKEPEVALAGTDFLRLINGGRVGLGPDR